MLRAILTLTLTIWAGFGGTAVAGEDFDEFVFSKQPGYDESSFRGIFDEAIEVRTVVIYCFDPRAVAIPEVVAREFGEVYPGELITSEQGNKVAATASLFGVVVAGGRATDALRSITVAQHLAGIQNVVIVHHTQCGATSFTADGIINAWQQEHDADISEIYDSGSIAIGDFETSLGHDVRLMRDSKGTPQHVSVYGYLYNIDSNELTLIVEDKASPASMPKKSSSSR